MTTETKTRVEKEINRSVHKQRVPIGRFRNILSVPDLPPNKVGRWVVDRDAGNRIQMFLNAGYEFVTQKGLIVGERKVDASKETGDVVARISGGETLYLMAIDRALYEQDQAAKQLKVDEVERAMDAEARKESRYGEGLQAKTS